jgi:D-beta-D-heptose 7-phosphate kinase/D-beta-D-heptose 1-phosphate adenosyltransferase
MKQIVVNGTFDILHRGHIELLEYAKSLGDYLLVCIDTDERVSELKGPSRPINNQNDRKYMLESLQCVDSVATFSSDQELEQILAQYQADIMVKGSDYQGRPIVGAELCKQIIFYERVPNYSTTQTIQRIANR